MKRAILMSALIGSCIVLQAQSVQELIAQGITLEKQRKETEALFKYTSALKKEPTNYKAICQASWLYARVGYRIADVEKKKKYFQNALLNAQKAVQMKPGDAQSNYLVSLAYGRLAQISSAKQRVAMIKEIKKYALQSLKIDPNHAGANHVMGSLNYRIANLSGVERAAANLILGGIPKGSNEMAASYYAKAVKLDPTYILYRRDLSFALNKLKQNEKAKAQLSKAISLPVRTEDDPGYIRTCKAMLNKLQ